MATDPTQTDDIPDDVPDNKLTAAQRQQIQDLAQRMIDNGNASITDDEQATIPRAILRRAWRRYQAANEASPNVREKYARQRARDDNARAMEGM